MERREDQRRDERRRRLRGGRVSKPPEERRRELLETAMRLFTERGYENTSMRDIAEELGLSLIHIFVLDDIDARQQRQALCLFIELLFGHPPPAFLVFVPALAAAARPLV